MSKQFPGPDANVMHPTADTAIYAYQNCGSTQYGTGVLNYVNPTAPQGKNNDAINAAFGNNMDPNRAVTSPGYVPEPSLVDACAAFKAWYPTASGSSEHPKPHSKDKKHG
jgi:hypothetical protein